MFDIFGEFDSAEEINFAAIGLRNEGDLENIRKLAEENGLDRELAELFIGGELAEICDVTTAALGKLYVEEQEKIMKQEIAADWVSYVRGCAGRDEEMAAAVRRKGKSLSGLFAAILKWSFRHAYDVDPVLLEAAGAAHAKVKLGIPGMANVKKIIRG